MKKPFISVVIPAYNEEKSLPKTLNSLAKQTLDRSLYEVIVVDNNSTDKTSAVAKKWGAKVVFEKKQGIVPARDKGLRAAKGEVLASTDADTILPSFWLEKIYNHFQTNPDLMGVFGSVHFQKKNGSLFPQIAYWFLNLAFSLNLRLGKPLFVGANYAIRRKPFLQAGGYRPIKGDIDDIPTGLIIGSLGKVAFDPSLIACPSPRRLEKEGLLQNAFFALTDYFRMAWLKKPVARTGALSAKDEND